MAASKNTFSSNTFESNAFACGTFRTRLVIFAAGDGGGQHRIPPNRPGQVICENKPGHRIPSN